jgi:predicted transcriptional regulator
MAYRPVRLGMKMTEDPAAAFKQLHGLFAKHGTMEAVAKHLAVDRHTLQRWVARLAKAGLGDPRTKPTG